MKFDASLLEDKESRQRINDALDRADSESGLLLFIKRAWDILEPERPFVSSWHIEAICDHLEAVHRGDILRLLINIPPGCMKSLTTEVFFPAWEWGPKNRPSLRYVSASYSEQLTIRDNRKCRNLILSPWYQRLWGSRFQLVEDQNAKIRYETNKTGVKIATSVGGLGTGERGDRFIVDDPHNIKESESDIKREAVLLWFAEVVPTRMNDPAKSALIVIMQRTHESDVSGDIIAKELGYEHLCLPMEFDPEKKCKTSIFEDPRKEEGELLWPIRFPRDIVERDKRSMTEYAVAGQFQQQPQPRGGAMLKEEWFEIVDAAPVGGRAVRGWDLAGSETQGAAFTAGVKMQRAPNGFYYILDAKRMRESPANVEKTIKNTASMDGVAVKISIPQDPGQAGKAQAQYLIRQLSGFVARATVESGDKITRAEPFAAQAEAGNVKIVRGPWNRDYLNELTKFPNSTFKDYVDATSRSFNELATKRTQSNVAAPEAIAVNG